MKKENLTNLRRYIPIVSLLMINLVCSASQSLSQTILSVPSSGSNLEILSTKQKNTEAWLRTFAFPISDFYFLKPVNGEKSAPSANNIYVLLDSTGNVNELRSFATGELLYQGCKFTQDKNGIYFVENALGNRCEKSIQKKVKKGMIKLPSCAFETNDKFSTTKAYFYDKKTSKVSCLYRQIVNTNNKSVTDAQNELINFKLAEVFPSHKNDFGGLLNAYFQSAPYLSSDAGIDKARNCIGYPDGVGAVGQSAPSDLVKLSDPNLIWSFLYLIKFPRKFKCSDVAFQIDAAVKSGPRLNDGTAIVYGVVSALRVDLKDGTSQASSGLVKAIPIYEFIEKMQADGGNGCVRGDEPCKWIGHYDYTKVVGDPIYYGKYWYQGFNNAVNRLFF